ncbi:MAG TPA: cytidylate kinase-like family protein [Methylococcaceae bacterium]|jgi:cytidylate kinase|nr:cytidylate kinase-like family protein [Methylococcaceae bacterium]
MPTDPLIYLQTLLSKDYVSAQYAKSRKKKEHEPLVITLSRDYGALGETIAKQLAECLGIPVYDQEILEMVAKRAKTDKFYLQAHDEQAGAGVTTFLYSLLSGSTTTLESYRRHLYETVLDIARKDCLIIGRGAHLILSAKKVFRVRIVGSEPVCANRIATELSIPLREAEQRVNEINSKRHKSVMNLYSDSFEHCSLEVAKNFDLIINTDHIPAEGAMPVILMAMQQSGFDLSEARLAG